MPRSNGQHGALATQLMDEIGRGETVQQLARIAAEVPKLQRSLAAAGAGAHGTGRAVTAVVDALTRRLLQLAERRLGPSPLPCAWVAVGSQARAEHTAGSDQDNCLVLDDGWDESTHAGHFEQLSRFVCDGLAACGCEHCPGGMTAIHPRWRLPRRRWAALFHQWIEQPDPMALMLTCVFFDQRCVGGQAALLESLRAEVLARSRGHTAFLARMACNALKHRPPPVLFGLLLPARGGGHAGTVDLKHSGLAPIVELARVYALAGGIAAVNTHDRLAEAPAGGEVTPRGADDLSEALEVLGGLRLAHQARQIEAGQAPDSLLALEELSRFERSQLKNAFAVVRTMQSVLQARYLQ